MTTSARLAGFVLILAVALGGGYGVGAAVGPLEDATTPSVVGMQAHGGAGEQAEAGGSAPDEVGDGEVTDDGYSLVATTTMAAPRPGVPFEFTIAGPDGKPVTEYEVEHTKELHLIGVRRDGAGYVHVHPARDAAGLWSAALDLTPGPWRLIADTVPADAPGKVTPSVDVLVTGDYTPVAPPAPSSAAAVDGYTVTLTGTATAGESAELVFGVARAGQPVTPDPYLGARGHLVAVREADLAYLHVHADTDALSFAASFPTPGRYRLFLDISVDGPVRTAPFVIEVAP